MQHVEHNNGQIAKQAKRSCTKVTGNETMG